MMAPPPLLSPRPDYVEPPEVKTNPGIKREKKRGTWKAVGAGLVTMLGSSSGGLAFNKLTESDTRDKVIRLETKFDEHATQSKEIEAATKRRFHRLSKGQALEKAQFDVLFDSLKVSRSKRPTEADVEEAAPEEDEVTP